MASSTGSEMSKEIDVQLSPEEKESLDEIIKEAESDLESEEVLGQSLAIVAENEGLDKDAAAKLNLHCRWCFEGSNREPLKRYG